MTPARSAALRFGVFVLLLAGLFLRPLADLAAFAVRSELYSYIILVPVVSLSLIRRKREQLPRAPQPSPWLTLAPLLAAVLVLAWTWLPGREGRAVPADLRLFCSSLAFVLLLMAGVLFFLGRGTLRAIAFPFAFLFFVVPLPEIALAGVESFLQHTSAAVAGGLFAVSDLPVTWQGLEFHLPGMILTVAPECSGIRSSVVLFMAVLLAGHEFLQKPWSRLVLAAVVIPVAIVRNAVRIFSIAWLCVRVDPAMIDSWIHRRGGPLFFALSLVPLFALLVLLRRAERRRVTKP